VKAQFATVEALLSLILVVGITLSASMILNSYSSENYIASRETSAAAEIYDIESNANVNATLKSCINYAAQGNTTCLGSYIQYYSHVYGQGGIVFVVNNRSVGSLSGAYEIECMPIEEGEACIEVGV